VLFFLCVGVKDGDLFGSFLDQNDLDQAMASCGARASPREVAVTVSTTVGLYMCGLGYCVLMVYMAAMFVFQCVTFYVL